MDDMTAKEVSFAKGKRVLTDPLVRNGIDMVAVMAQSSSEWGQIISPHWNHKKIELCEDPKS